MSIVALVDPLPVVPAILDPNFNKTIDNSNAQDFVDFDDFPFHYFFFEGQSLSQPDLQYMRHLMKNFIQVLATEVQMNKRAAHVMHEAADKDNPETEKFFRAHSIYRSRLANARKHLRRCEQIQRKIRVMISES